MSLWHGSKMWNQRIPPVPQTPGFCLRFVGFVFVVVQHPTPPPLVVLLSLSSSVPRRSGNWRHLPVQLALVEGKLLALEDVAVAAAGLAGAAGDDSVQAAGLELALEGVVDLAGGGKARSLLLLDGAGLLGRLLQLALLLLPPAAQGLAVVGLVPLAEGGSVDLDDGRLGQGVGADQLVVGRVVDDADDTGLARAALRGPREVARVETERAVLVVAAARADGVDALGTDTGVGGLAAGLESALLPYWQRSERMSMVEKKERETSSRTETSACPPCSFPKSDTGFRKKKKPSAHRSSQYFFSSCLRLLRGSTHGSRHASRRRRSACGESLWRYPW